MRKLLMTCAPWVFAAISVAAQERFADQPQSGWLKAIEEARAAPQAGRSRLVGIDGLRKLPTWGLKAVAEAAARRLVASRDSVTYRNLQTEIERRRAKAAS